MMVVAHAGHWLVPVLYASPLAVVAGLLAWTAIRDRRRERADDDSPSSGRAADEA